MICNKHYFLSQDLYHHLNSSNINFHSFNCQIHKKNQSTSRYENLYIGRKVVIEFMYPSNLNFCYQFDELEYDTIVFRLTWCWSFVCREVNVFLSSGCRSRNLMTGADVTLKSSNPLSLLKKGFRSFFTLNTEIST